MKICRQGPAAARKSGPFPAGYRGVPALLTRTRRTPTQRGSERVAQAVEHVTFNHGVVGSSPTALTMLINDLYLISLTQFILAWPLCTHCAPIGVAGYSSFE